MIIFNKKLYQYLLQHKFFCRLNSISTMLPPPNIYTNRYNHSIDVIKTSEEVHSKLNINTENKYIFKIAALCHDIGHLGFAHEGEKAITEFLLELFDTKTNFIGYSHSLNSAINLVVNINAITKKELTNNLLCFSSKPKEIQELNYVLNIIAKHSFNENVKKGEYLCFTNFILSTLSPKLKIETGSSSYNILEDLVKVSDDISTKQSDIFDLIQLYFNKKIYHNNFIKKYYINLLEQEYKENPKETLESIYQNFSTLVIEKRFLKASYNIGYKKNISDEVESITKIVYKHLLMNPKSLNYLNNPAYIWIRNLNKIFYNSIKKNKLTITGDEYLNNIVDSLNNYNHLDCIDKKIVRFYCYSIAYQYQNFSEKQILNFYKNKMGNKLPTIIEEAYF